MNDIYIGKPDQQSQVIRALTKQIRQTPQGIFVVGGPLRTGKNTAITKTVEDLGYSIQRRYDSVIRPDINMLDEDPEEYLGHWKEAYDRGQRFFAFGEIPVAFQNALSYIKEFYQQAVHDREKLKILFNVISREHPAWKNSEIESLIKSGLRRVFADELRLHTLQTDKKRIMDELWRQRDRGELELSAKVLGFQTYTDDWYALDEVTNHADFERRIMRMMNETDYRHPERR